MSALVSMVVPLHTLPGWPAAPNPPWLDIAGLLLGLPLGVVILFSLIGKLTAARHQNSRPVAVAAVAADADEPLWLGGPEGAGTSIPGGERKALPPSVTATGAAAEQPQTVQQTGGASARW